MIPWTCDCGYSGQTADENAGKRAKCPKCERIFRLPELSDDDFEEDFEEEEVSWPRRSSAVVAKAKKGNSRRDTAAKRKRARPRQKAEPVTGAGSQVPMWALVGGVALVSLLLIGGVGVVAMRILGGGPEPVAEKEEKPAESPIAVEPAVAPEIIPLSDMTEACYVRPSETEGELQIWFPGRPTLGSITADIGRGETPSKKWTLNHELGRFEYICIKNPSAFRHEAMLGLARSTVKHLKDEFPAVPPKVTRLSKAGTHGEQAVYTTEDGKEVVQYRIYGLGSTAHALIFRAAERGEPVPLINPTVVKFFGSLKRAD